MFPPATLVYAWLFWSLLLIPFSQRPPENTPASKPKRVQMKQEHLCCNLLDAANPVYPREARLAHIEGEVRLKVIFAINGGVAEVQDISGDPLLVGAVTTAVRKWRTQPVLLDGIAAEAEVALVYTFKIQDPPKPAYLHLTNGEVIRADEVREFTDGTVEYKADRQTHRISMEVIRGIYHCGRDCVPGGGPIFNITAFPLWLPGRKTTPNR